MPFILRPELDTACLEVIVQRELKDSTRLGFMQVKLWELDWDSAAAKVGAGEEEMLGMVEKNQEEMTSVRLFFPSESNFAALTDHPDLLHLIGMSRVGYRQDEAGNTTEVTCRQS
jgi:hypothetical protein